MSILKSDDILLDKQEDIEQHVLPYNTSLYASDNTCIDTGFVGRVIPKSVSTADNASLTSLPTLDEVKASVFAMNGSGALGPDGFSRVFFQTFWDIVGSDMYKSVLQFFTQGWILPNMNSNLITLAPKFQGVDRIEDYRPIALANFQLKVIAKVLADKLSMIAPKIISEQQRWFIKGRHISEGICITS